MIVLTHCYYACTARVAASRCHSVPCTTSLRINYNVTSPGISQATRQSSVTPPADREATNLQDEYLSLECTIHFAKLSSTMFGGNYRFFGLLELRSTHRSVLPQTCDRPLAALIGLNCQCFGAQIDFLQQSLLEMPVILRSSTF